MCARRARGLLAGTLNAFDVPPQTIGDAELMVSELATNAFRHAGHHGPHELWLFPGGELDRAAADPGACEIVCAVFDALPDLGLLADNSFSGDFGRGLSIVAEISHGRWGAHPARSRLHHEVPGKAVWFACQVPFAVLRSMVHRCEGTRHLHPA
ncbi:ATP-binding protein [Actinomadura alba]|uniref:ATP-binding protein n=1 Tax=Actinomadura alba TaxID=406431 RepID=A0ABR7LZ51_9ACTN|nr:ATP-binding protein [Actinomadura alba]MBC6470061.1 ATP-binding protein [Actinomadura alba]